MFWKKKLKRVQLDKAKNATNKNQTVERIRNRTNVLFGIMFSLLIFFFLAASNLFNLTEIITLIPIISITIFLVAWYLKDQQKQVVASSLKVFWLGLLISSLLGLSQIFVKLNWPFHFLPLTLVAMIITVGYSQHLALIIIFFQMFLLGLLLKNHHAFDITLYFPGTILAILSLTHIRNRAKLIKVGILAGACHLIMIYTGDILINIDRETVFFSRELWTKSLQGFANGFISGFVMLGILPFLEGWFRVITDQSLLELADMNQPLLKELSLTAPGTYHHSLRVGDLAEAAAEIVGANALLARVGAYYHDIGKLNKPEYFVENDLGLTNKHKDISPTMSVLIITAHVKDGIELARYHKLPNQVVNFVHQHHGTSVVKYFYREALYQSNTIASETSTPSEITEESFRYAGPKPQSREIAIVLLADSIEASSRSLSNITPAKLEGLIHEIIMEKLLDGQLDQSNLTMTDFKQIEKSFIRVLVGMFHSRIKYPGKYEI